MVDCSAAAFSELTLKCNRRDAEKDETDAEKCQMPILLGGLRVSAVALGLTHIPGFGQEEPRRAQSKAAKKKQSKTSFASVLRALRALYVPKPFKTRFNIACRVAGFRA